MKERTRTSLDVDALQHQCKTFVRTVFDEAADPAHDLEHIRRVVRNAQHLAEAEGACWKVVAPAAWLHDCVLVRKDSELRSSASMLAADRAGAFLREEGYPAALIPEVEHAIAAHSYSAGIEPQTIEAKVVQDADRLDALGAIGIARTMTLGGAMQLPLYDPSEPFPDSRPADDGAYILDHFYVKLLRLEGRMQTDAGRKEALRRTRFMREYLKQLREEISDE